MMKAVINVEKDFLMLQKIGESRIGLNQITNYHN